MPRKKTRVLLLSQAPGVGGGERVAIDALARAQSLEVTVAGYEAVCEFAGAQGLQTVLLPFPWIRGWKQSLSLLRGALRVRALARRTGAQVLYANGSRAFPYAVGARVLGGPPVLAHHHGLFTQGPIRSMVMGVERFSSLIVVPSNAVAEPFEDSTKIRVIPNGIDLQKFHPVSDRLAAKRKLGLPDDRLVVGTVTRADPRKGMEAFLQLAERFVGAEGPHFLLVGGATFPSEIEHLEAMKTRAAALKTALTMTGRIDDVVPALQAMDVFVHLSEPEGLPTTVIESLACGVPVIAYEWGGVKEIITNGDNGFLVIPGDLKAVADMLETALTDSQWRLRAARTGREQCEASFEIHRFEHDLSVAIVEAAGE